MLQKRTIRYEPADIDRAELVTLSEAAGIVGVSLESVSIRASKNQLTVYMDPDAHLHQGRVLLLRREVERWATERGPGKGWKRRS